MQYLTNLMQQCEVDYVMKQHLFHITRQNQSITRHYLKRTLLGRLTLTTSLFVHCKADHYYLLINVVTLQTRRKHFTTLSSKSVLASINDMPHELFVANNDFHGSDRAVEKRDILLQIEEAIDRSGGDLTCQILKMQQLIWQPAILAEFLPWKSKPYHKKPSVQLRCPPQQTIRESSSKILADMLDFTTKTKSLILWF